MWHRVAGAAGGGEELYWWPAPLQQVPHYSLLQEVSADPD